MVTTDRAEAKDAGASDAAVQTTLHIANVLSNVPHLLLVDDVALEVVQLLTDGFDVLLSGVESDGGLSGDVDHVDVGAGFTQGDGHFKADAAVACTGVDISSDEEKAE